MTKIQPLLQRGLTALDPWLDAVFPVATALICTKQRLAGYSLLVIYIALRLLQRSDKEPWRWILISLLVVNAGLIIEDRDLRPGSASDYLIVALSFAAGMHRTREQWNRALAWMASCIVPLLALSLHAGPNMIEGASSFSGFNINKLGFLAGLLTVVAYGWLRQGQSPWPRALAAGAIAMGISEAILTQSRAALAVPILTITIDILISHRWSIRQYLITGFLCIALTSGAIYSWYFQQESTNTSSHENRLSDLNRFKTIECWIQTASQSKHDFLLGLGYGKSVQGHCGPEQIPSLHKMEKTKGLQHAHNLYAQIFAETGISGLLLAVGLTISGCRGGGGPRGPPRAVTLPLLIYIAVMALGLTFWQVMMINQVLVGYSLAALTAKESDPAAADAATPGTQPA
jgi:O-antigen ligase